MRADGGSLTKTAETGLLVVFAYVRREVGNGDGADIGGCFDGTDGAGRGVRVFLDEGLVRCLSFVGVGGFYCCCCGILGCRWRSGAGSAEEILCGRLLVFIVPVALLGGIVCGFYERGAIAGEFGG